MSYRAVNDIQSVTISYSGSRSCGKCGNSVSYSGSASETVHIVIDVYDDPFNDSVAHCNKNVNLLTGAVVATETAQVASINKNSKKVADTIVDGFFSLIRSEISQQIAELSKDIDADLMYLRGMAKKCIEKQKQMETDYNRITSRYLKIFEDLNKELENRIFELNKPAFVFKNNSDNHANRTTENDLVSTVTVFGLEGGELQAKISASIAKKRTLNAINQANIFLWKQKKLQSMINQSMLNESISATKYSPVCFLETNNEKSRTERNVYQANFLPEINSNVWIDKFKNQNWTMAAKESKDHIQRYFNSEVSNAYNSNNKHDNRVKEMIVKIFDINSVKSI